MRNEDISGIRELVARSVAAFRKEGPDRLFFYGIRYLSWELSLHHRVQSLPTPLTVTIFLLTKTIVRGSIRLLNAVYPHRYTDADPYKYILVDPSSIEYTTGEILSKRRGWVVEGEWDEDGDHFMQRTYPKAIEQRLVEGLEWEETALAEKYDDQRLEERGNTIDRLYELIYDDGYKSQAQLLEENPEATWKGLNDAMHPLANEIAVDIGRNGELLWNICGQHRLAIAKVLDIDRIPVQVFRRHTEWQKLRDDIRRGNELPERLRTHPDLQDIIDN